MNSKAIVIDSSLLKLAQNLSQWRLDESKGTMAREFVFQGFEDAFAFMTEIAKVAEQHNHHPEWRNVYNKVWITWTTHDANGLSNKDIHLAQICDQLFMKYA
jgi:4a-hydroxytetrahydrobiopterin dehydratase